MFVRRAFLAVCDKTGLLPFAEGLTSLGVDLIATPGTVADLKSADIVATPIAEVTGFPDAFLGGRVKTLQPSVYAGLLADRESAEHMDNLARHGFLTIDLLCLNLYPFGSTDQDDTAGDAAITHIDIGGPMLLRAAALNHRFVLVVSHPCQYAEVLGLLRDNRNEIPEQASARFAAQAFSLVASYEQEVSNWFAEHCGTTGSRAPSDQFSIDWTPCSQCGGAVAAPSVDLCVRHLAAGERRRVLQQLEGAIDLRNVQVAPSLFGEVLASASGQDGRPRLASLQCQWTRFEGPVSLREAIVSGDVDFSGARFNGQLNCDGMSIDGDLRCRNTHLRAASFERIRVRGLVTFRSTDFREVTFDGAEFGGPAIFEGSDFAVDASYRGVGFREVASFIGATFHASADFRGANWAQGCRVRDASFGRAPRCDDLTRFREAAWPADETPLRVKRKAEVAVHPQRCKIFVGSSAEAIEIAHAVQRNLDHATEPVVWQQGVFTPGAMTAVALRSALADFDFAAFVCAEDDVTTLRGRELATTRDNVIWELGLSAGVLGLERTFVIKPRDADLRIPTDLDGIVVADYDATRENLVAALGAACGEILDAIRKLGARP